MRPRRGVSGERDKVGRGGRKEREIGRERDGERVRRRKHYIDQRLRPIFQIM